jgi:hypothetical protein
MKDLQLFKAIRLGSILYLPSYNFVKDLVGTSIVKIGIYDHPVVAPSVNQQNWRDITITFSVVY